MTYLICEKTVRANKDHRCGLCGGKIAKGTLYRRHNMAGADGPYVFKEHERCNRISGKIWEYVDPDEGMTEDEFRDAVEQLMSDFVCPFRCEHYDKDDGYCEHSEPMSDECLDRFDEYLKTHRLKLVRGTCGFEWKMEEIKDNGEETT